jgi:hypothetical protein
MGRIMGEGKGRPAQDAFGARRLIVRGVPYDNTAAKFWTCLLDEVAADYPAAVGVALSAPTSGLLSPELLAPERVLQRDLSELEAGDVRNAFADAMSALEIIGPPCGVRLRLLAAHGEVASRDIALDYLDAEILPFLIVWLLEWSCVPEFFWNAERVHGDFSGRDADRGIVYRLAFELRTRHLSEGLFDREIRVRFQREAPRRSGAAPTAPAASGAAPAP